MIKMLMRWDIGMDSEGESSAVGDKHRHKDKGWANQEMGWRRCREKWVDGGNESRNRKR